MCSFRYVSFSHKAQDQGRDVCVVRICYTPAVPVVGLLWRFLVEPRFSLTSNHLFKALFLLLFFFVAVVVVFDTSLPHTLKLLALLVTPISSVSCSFHRANFRIASILMPSNRPTLLQLIEYIFCYPREEKVRQEKWRKITLGTENWAESSRHIARKWGSEIFPFGIQSLHQSSSPICSNFHGFTEFSSGKFPSLRISCHHT